MPLSKGLKRITFELRDIVEIEALLENDLKDVRELKKAMEGELLTKLRDMGININDKTQVQDYFYNPWGKSVFSSIWDEDNDFK